MKKIIRCPTCSHGIREGELCGFCHSVREQKRRAEEEARQRKEEQTERQKKAKLRRAQEEAKKQNLLKKKCVICGASNQTGSEHCSPECGNLRKYVVYLPGGGIEFSPAGKKRLKELGIDEKVAVFNYTKNTA